MALKPEIYHLSERNFAFLCDRRASLTLRTYSGQNIPPTLSSPPSSVLHPSPLPHSLTLFRTPTHGTDSKTVSTPPSPICAISLVIHRNYIYRRSCTFRLYLVNKILGLPLQFPAEAEWILLRWISSGAFRHCLTLRLLLRDELWTRGL